MLDKIQTDLKNAQLNRDEVKVSTLRLLLSEIKNGEISLRQSSPRQSLGQAGQEGLSDEDIISIVQRELKKRKEAAVGFRSGGREESAQREELEAKVLEGYLPAQISSEELTKIIEDTISELGATSPADMGKVMGVIMGKVAGRSDGGIISALVKERLAK